jgi:hypothetical protein
MKVRLGMKARLGDGSMSRECKPHLGGHKVSQTAALSQWGRKVRVTGRGFFPSLSGRAEALRVCERLAVIGDVTVSDDIRVTVTICAGSYRYNDHYMCNAYYMRNDDLMCNVY